MRIVYLHGFASSPHSSKARWFGERFHEHGIAIDCPDLNEPDFRTLTVSRMVQQVEQLLEARRDDDVVLMGSSLGGLVAWLVAARDTARRRETKGTCLTRLVLLAPAWDFGEVGFAALGVDAVTRWRETGTHVFFHYGYDAPREVGYALHADASRHRADLAHLSAPTLVFHGIRDEVVSADMVVRFASARPNVMLRLLDDDHQLHGHLDAMWDATASFLGLRPK